MERTKTKLSSKYIYKFYEAIDNIDTENHGLLIMQHGETLYEEYPYPYNKDTVHTMFSITKSMVATAVGFAIDEKLITLDTKVYKFFPDIESASKGENRDITVKALLTMNSNKKYSFLNDMTADQVKIFFDSPFRKKKRGFFYSNNDIHILSAMLQRVTGMPVVDYLTPRLFEPLGIDVHYWEKDLNGVCCGGAGSYFTLRDIAKICYCYSNDGKYNGEQVIPSEWTRIAVQGYTKVTNNPWYDSYGYCFWPKNGTFAMVGLFGQIAAYIPEHDCVIVTFNSCIESHPLKEYIFNILAKAFEPDEDDGEYWDKKLKAYLSKKNELIIPDREKINVPLGKTFRIDKPSKVKSDFLCQSSLVPKALLSSFSGKPEEGINNISFDLSDEALMINWTEGKEKVSVKCGINGKTCMTDITLNGAPYKVWAYAYSENGNLNAVIKPLNTLGTQKFTFEFGENELYMKTDDTPDFRTYILSNLCSVEPFMSHPELAKCCAPAVKLILTVTAKAKYKYKQI